MQNDVVQFIPTENVKSFIEYLQDQIQSLIVDYSLGDDGVLNIQFDLKSDDSGLKKISKEYLGKWRPPATLRIENFLNHWPQAEAENEIHKEIKTLETMRREIFAEIHKQGRTLREVAHKSGLTEMSLHNYRHKGNLRFDNLLKLCEVLNIRLYLQTSTPTKYKK